jgi:hypothetical protein
MRLFTLDHVVIVLFLSRIHIHSRSQKDFIFHSRLCQTLKNQTTTKKTRERERREKAEKHTYFRMCDDNDDDKRGGNNYFYLAYYSVSNKISARVVVENFHSPLVREKNQ